MIHLNAEGWATACAALCIIAISMAVHAKQQHRARVLAKYRRGEQDREVRQLLADTLESINVAARGVR